MSLDHWVQVILIAAALGLYVLWQSEKDRAECYKDAFAIKAGFYEGGVLDDLSEECKDIVFSFE